MLERFHVPKEHPDEGPEDSYPALAEPAKRRQKDQTSQAPFQSRMKR